MVAAVDAGSETQRLVDAAGCGIWVPPEDPGALVEAMRALHGDPGLRAEMGQRGRAHVAAHYTPQVVAQRYDGLLRAVAAG
jgi:glycosyltransferase involved in cell wall biosynthesis